MSVEEALALMEVIPPQVRAEAWALLHAGTQALEREDEGQESGPDPALDARRDPALVRAAVEEGCANTASYTEPLSEDFFEKALSYAEARAKVQPKGK